MSRSRCDYCVAPAQDVSIGLAYHVGWNSNWTATTESSSEWIAWSNPGYDSQISTPCLNVANFVAEETVAPVYDYNLAL